MGFKCKVCGVEHSYGEVLDSIPLDVLMAHVDEARENLHDFMRGY